MRSNQGSPWPSRPNIGAPGCDGVPAIQLGLDRLGRVGARRLWSERCRREIDDDTLADNLDDGGGRFVFDYDDACFAVFDDGGCGRCPGGCVRQPVPTQPRT